MPGTALLDKVVVVTGVGSGIGKGIGLKFLSEGANLVGSELVADRVSEFVTEAVALGIDDDRFRVLPGDVRDYDFCGRLIDQAREQFGKVDILVNNVGGSLGFGGTAFKDLGRDAWKLTVDTNLYATLNCTQHTLRYMIPQRSGHILNIASTIGMSDTADIGALYSVYAAAKAGVISFTRAIASEVGSYNIRVNCISPGVTRTRYFQRVTPEYIEELRKKTSLGRVGEPEDIAKAAVFLVTDQADYITGHNLVVSGGLVLH